MSDDRQAPDASSQAAQWRARAQQNRQAAERKRRRSLESDGGITVAEMMARNSGRHAQPGAGEGAAPPPPPRPQPPQPPQAAQRPQPPQSRPQGPQASRRAERPSEPPAPPRTSRPPAPRSAETPPRTRVEPEGRRSSGPRAYEPPAQPEQHARPPQQPPAPQGRPPRPPAQRPRERHPSFPNGSGTRHEPVPPEALRPDARPEPRREPRRGERPEPPAPQGPQNAQGLRPEPPRPPRREPPRTRQAPPVRRPPRPAPQAPPEPPEPPETSALSSVLDGGLDGGDREPPRKPEPTRRVAPVGEPADAARADDVDESAAEAPARPRRPAPPKPRRRQGERPERSKEDRLTMTDQMEPVDEATQYRRRIDNTLARFSAAHDELEAEERQRSAKRERLAARLEQTRTALQRVVLPQRARAKQDDKASRDDNDDDESHAAALATELAPDVAEGHAEDGEDGKAATQTRLQEKKQRHNDRTLLIARVTAIGVAAVVLLTTGIAWGAKTWFNSQFREIAALDENSDDIRNAAGQLGDENFLLIGSDTRDGAKAGDNVGTAANVKGARSDTIMVAHVPKDRKRAVVVSFPRDLEISRPECQQWDSHSGEYGDAVPADEQVKLNSAFNMGGPRCLLQVIQGLTGMKINHFVGIDFQGFKGMVDAVGGVTVHVDEPMRDEELGMVISQTGDVKIKGQQALNYVRARKVYSDPTFSDYGRMQRQQQFLSSLLSATLSQNVLLDPGRLTDFVNAFAASTFGDNVGVDQLLTLAQSMRGLSAGKVEFMTVPTVGDANDRGNEVLLDADTHDLFQALIDNTPLPGEEPEQPKKTEQADDAGPPGAGEGESPA